VVEDQEHEVALVLGVVEQGAEPDVRALGDLAHRRRAVAEPREQLGGRRAYALALVELVALAQPRARARLAALDRDGPRGAFHGHWRAPASSSRMPVRAITARALARSVRRNCANSFGLLPTASNAWVRRNSRNAGLPSARTSSAFRRSTTIVGV